ncbi:rrna-processing protein efg1 [Venturia nashicola]|uniref:rRNA-processing protein EFG1 n=1 Tax=Venturia nashicola TaxID=86259 RepID=A0A4Z1PA92_9PEZI|nr:rrna-processing protein efg1 [Venturia nashicola]TLD36545.1 rrna-processing protein efg1 [Venturia nashicola]
MAAPPNGPQPAKRKAQFPESETHRAYKRNQKNRESPYDGRDAHPKRYATRPLKDGIRDLERMLKGAKMPADIRQTRERELEALKLELVKMTADKEKQEMIGRYHMVRFFDRKKAERRLKQATKALRACEDSEEHTKLEQDVHVAQIDLNYTQYYPLAQTYSSLYPTKKGEDGKQRGDEEETKKGIRGNPEMWKEVEQATEDGERKLEELRHRIDWDRIRTTTLAARPKAAAAASPSKSASKESDSGGANLPKNRRQIRDEARKNVQLDDDDSDGGFFE